LIFEYKNGNITIIDSSTDSNITRVSTGVFNINRDNDDLFNFRKNSIIGRAYANGSSNRIGDNYTDGLNIICKSFTQSFDMQVEPGGHVVYRWFAVDEIGFYTPTGTLKDPVIAILFFVA
jgi:hypothetical protein